MGQSCTSFRYCFFETSENDGTLEVQVNPRQIEKRQVENPRKKVCSKYENTPQMAKVYKLLPGLEFFHNFLRYINDLGISLSQKLTLKIM